MIAPAEESERLWRELADQKAILLRLETHGAETRQLAQTTADSVFALHEALRAEREERRKQDQRITTATADAIVTAVRDQLDRRAAMSGSLSSAITAGLLWFLFRR
jgi:hypothetical protein